MIRSNLYRVIITLLIMSLFCTACSNKENPDSPGITGSQTGQAGQTNTGTGSSQAKQGDNSTNLVDRGPCGHGDPSRQRQITAPDVRELTRPLEGKITVLTVLEYEDALPTYIDLFNHLHPSVQIEFETIPPPVDMAQQSALMTRLQSSPPDIYLFSSSDVNFEKISMDALFLDLYDFFDGSRGIDENNYFSNIFRASEMNGSLYYLPIQIIYDIAVLNKKYFEGIDVDATKISTLTIDDEIDLFFRVSEAFPGDTIYLSNFFSIFEALKKDPMYNVETGSVFVNTPEMKDRLERAMQVKVDESSVELSPDGYMFSTTYSNDNLARAFTTQRNRNVILPMSGFGGSLQILTGLFLRNHMDTTLSQPIMLLSGSCSHPGFRSLRSLAIMRDAPNPDLAWEFMRFIMEYEDSLYKIGEIALGEITYSGARNSFPINRTRFENQVYDVLHQIAYEAYAFSGIQRAMAPVLNERIEAILVENASSFNQENLNPEQRRSRAANIAQEELISQDMLEAMDYLRDNMESLVYENRTNYVVLLSIVYPDIWLLYSGQQTVSQTLANIQNRLELYLSE